MGEQGHARYSPSQLPRIIDCPGSVVANENLSVNTESSKYADEGTMLHKVTEECLDIGETTVSQETINKFALKPDHVDAVQECLDFMGSLAMEYGDPKAYYLLEKRVSLSTLAEALKCEELTDVEGTADVGYLFPEDRALHIIDWKFGAGIEVFPDSDQLKAYAVGFLLSLAKEVRENINKVVLTIMQPRLHSGDIKKTEVTTRKELSVWVVEVLVPALKRTNLKNPPFNPTERACRWCKIKTTCKARKKQADQAATKVFELHASLPEVDVNDVVRFLNIAKELKGYISDLESWAYNRITSGEEVPGYKLVAGRSLRKWRDPHTAEGFLNEAIGVDASYTNKLLSPAQAEKVMKRGGMADEKFYYQIIKPDGKPTLVQEGDRRPALTYMSAEEKFADCVDDGPLLE